LGRALRAGRVKSVEAPGAESREEGQRLLHRAWVLVPEPGGRITISLELFVPAPLRKRGVLRYERGTRVSVKEVPVFMGKEEGGQSGPELVE
jgi:hypothetical protein